MSDNQSQLSGQISARSTADLSNAHPAARAMAMRIAPLWAGARICGPAKTVRIIPGQNAAIHRALHLASPGDVLVVDGGASPYFGPFGDILAEASQRRGVVGLVIDGTVRDRVGITAANFPVFCIGTSAQVTAKSDPGEVDVPITCGGIVVYPGDFVVGDEDGVVVMPSALISEIAEKAGKVIAREKILRERIAAGETTYEIFELSHLYGNRANDRSGSDV